MINNRYKSEMISFGYSEVLSYIILVRKLLTHPQLLLTDQNKLSDEFKCILSREDYEMDDWAASSKFQFVVDILKQVFLNDASDEDD